MLRLRQNVTPSCAKSRHTPARLSHTSTAVVVGVLAPAVHLTFSCTQSETARARAQHDISVEDLKEVFYVSYEMAAHRLTNLVTHHFDLAVHFLRTDDDGVIWKAYENDAVGFPTDADGVILVEGAGPTYVEWSLDRAGRPDGFEVVTFTMLSVTDDRRDAYRPVVEFVAELITDRRPAFTVLPFFDELADRVATGGPEALVEMPADYWAEIGAIGTIDDALAHVAALEGAGVASINIFPGPQLELAWEQMPQVAALAVR